MTLNPKVIMRKYEKLSEFVRQVKWNQPMVNFVRKDE
jgi:hypothetical protein